jgi:hypothetical protein
MTRSLALIGILALAAEAGGEAPPRDVVVLKRAGVTAYEEVSEEFGDRCRVRARVVSFGDEGPHRARDRIGKHDLVVTVGQEALDAALAVGARVIPTLAFHTPRGLVGPPAAPTPELLLRVLQIARPTMKTIGAVYGPRSETLVNATAEAARRLGLQLTATRVTSGPEAVRALHALVKSQTLHAIWLPGDTDVMTPQVFQYALRLQLERGLPVAAATRHQVHSGALIAVDFSPRAAGRAAAELANRVLDGKSLDPEAVDLFGGARITVNEGVARRLGVDVSPLEKMGARIE